MGLLEQFEARLDRLVNGAFARAFRAEVQPIEIAAALHREMDDQRESVAGARPTVPNYFLVELATHDHTRLSNHSDAITSELVTVIHEHADEQRYVLPGPVEVILGVDEELDTGVFRVTSKSRAEISAESAATVLKTNPRLVGDDGQEFVITDVSVRVGRGQDVDIRLDDSSVSRVHAEIVLSNPPVIRDLNSTNGTTVNGKPVTEAVLHDGALIVLGTVHLTFRA